MMLIQRPAAASSLVAIVLLGMSSGLGQPPGPSGPPGDGGAGSQLAPCNGLSVIPYAIGERCEGSNGNCPPFDPNLTGGGCSMMTTLAGTIMSPLAGDQMCGTGTSGVDNCVEDPTQPEPCLYSYVCAPTAIPNPTYDPNDPSSPLIITVCALGARGAKFSDRFKPISPECAASP